MKEVFKEGAEAIIEAGGQSVNLCYQCGECSSICPWNLVRQVSVRRLNRDVKLGLIRLEDLEEIWWQCVTCGACTIRCPGGVKIIDVMKAVRSICIKWGIIPQSLKIAIGNIGALGNPWGEEREKRFDWTNGLEIRHTAKGTDFLLSPCCTPAYDPKAKRILIDMVKILRKAKVKFGILGAEESCCGESARKAGAEELFVSLAKKNIALFSRDDVRKVLTPSPHCFHTFKNEYSDLGCSIEVWHHTQLIRDLIKRRSLRLVKRLNKKIVFHDPCYLGRHNSIYNEPREILKNLPRVRLIEFPDRGENSLCCGGGGGRIWQETKKEERFSNIRIEQALSLGAQVIVTACPYCFQNLEESISTYYHEKEIEVKDIATMVAEAL